MKPDGSRVHRPIALLLRQLLCACFAMVGLSYLDLQLRRFVIKIVLADQPKKASIYAVNTVIAHGRLLTTILLR